MNQLHGEVSPSDIFATRGRARSAVTYRCAKVVHESGTLFRCAPLPGARYAQSIREGFGALFSLASLNGVNQVLSQVS